MLPTPLLAAGCGTKTLSAKRLAPRVPALIVLPEYDICERKPPTCYPPRTAAPNVACTNNGATRNATPARFRGGDENDMNHAYRGRMMERDTP